MQAATEQRGLSKEADEPVQGLHMQAATESSVELKEAGRTRRRAMTCRLPPRAAWGCQNKADEPVKKQA